MPLSVKDGMGAWIKDFQKSGAPQFKGKSDKERREMAMAAYLSAKRGDKNEGYVSAAQRKAVHATKADGGKGHPDNKKEEVKPPFTPDPKKPQAKNSDGTKTDPMSKARQLAKMARDRNMKKESVELDEMYASTVEPHKDGYRPKVVKDGSKLSYLGQHVYKSKEHARNAADHIAKGMRKGRASDSYIDDFARRHHKEHGMKESTQIDELDSKTYRSYSDKAGKELMRTDISPDKRSKRALGRATADMKKYGDKRTLSQRIRQDLNKEEVDLDEGMDKEKFQSAEAELVKYARAHGGMDKRDFMDVAKMLGQIGRVSILDAGQILSKLNRKLSSMDTDPRDKVYQILKQKKLMESVEEARKYYGTDDLGYSLRPGDDEPNTSPRRPASQPHAVHVNGKKWKSFPSAAMANKAAQTIKDRHGKNATVHKESVEVEEAKDFDQKFKDHLKFATSKSPAVKNYLAKRKADRDAMNKANDPNAAKKGYALTAVPPERAFKKAQKKGMSASDASQAVGTASRNRGRKLPK